jgi:Ca2+-binding EF-hand superfamily protein
VCIPYFKDIYKDLNSRSDDKPKGINRLSILEYAALPGMLGERFFQVMDLNNDGYVDYREFLTGLLRIYCSTFEQRTKFVFEIYDFDGDGLVSKEDISTILSYMPVTKSTPVLGEGKFTQEGGGAQDFNERIETMHEMYKILDICFEGKVQINFKEFQRINEEIASDMLLSVLNILREKLPCSENFWRYKRNYELHMQNS